MTLKTPLSRHEADAVRHIFETRAFTTADPRSSMESIGDYGEAIRWLVDLMSGETIEIPDDVMQRHLGLTAIAHA